MAFRLQRVVYVQDGGQCFNMAHHFAGGAASLHDRFSHDQAHDLAHMLDQRSSKHGLVMHKGGQQCITRYVARQHHFHHTWHG